MSYLGNFINLLFEVLKWAIIGRILISWIDPQQNWAISKLLHDWTEWLLAPVRKILPSFGMIDLSPLVVILLLQFLQQLFHF
ncbi:MAG: YggT family protein [Chloroflexota bacterium]|nr:YggT family protein [Chloroflexota bacterium]